MLLNSSVLKTKMSNKQYSPALADTLECTGCGACASVCTQKCIEMRPDYGGFMYPYIGKAECCIGCHMCEQTCPVLKKEKQIHTPQSYAAYTKDDTIRLHSSSGGLFSEFANIIINQNGYVYGAVFDKHFTVSHRCINTVNELQKLRGAKYSESRLGNTFIDIREKLNTGKKVLFSGTPCQVAGLKAFLKKDYDNLLCIDFVCHGVPSPVVWEKYVEYRARIDANNEMAQEVSLRLKDSGWSKYRYSVLFRYEYGKVYKVLNSQDPYMKLFVGDSILRSSCNKCSFKGFARTSDITLGDFWGIWNIDPDMDDDKGTSLVLIQSEKGKSYFDSIKSNIISKEESIESCSQGNKSILVSSPKKKDREWTISIISSRGFESYLKTKKIRNSLNRVKKKMISLTKK